MQLYVKQPSTMPEPLKLVDEHEKLAKTAFSNDGSDFRAVVQKFVTDNIQGRVAQDICDKLSYAFSLPCPNKIRININFVVDEVADEKDSLNLKNSSTVINSINTVPRVHINDSFKCANDKTGSNIYMQTNTADTSSINPHFLNKRTQDNYFGNSANSEYIKEKPELISNYSSNNTLKLTRIKNDSCLVYDVIKKVSSQWRRPCSKLPYCFRRQRLVYSANKTNYVLDEIDLSHKTNSNLQNYDLFN